jgi:membrane glycosyltransferase
MKHAIAFSRAARRRYTHGAAPAVQRGSMVPTPWLGFGASLARLWRGESSTVPVIDAALEAVATRRRNTLVALVLMVAVGASALLLLTQPLQGVEVARALQVLLFALLLAWVAAGTITALMGFFSLRNGDRHVLSHARVATQAIDGSARTALVMPICNENVATVFAGLAATAQSVVAAGGARLVEVYVLSDSSDLDTRRAEREAWLLLQERLAPTGLKLHYRWRARRTKKKAGNVADFCRRFGARHRYMVVLDADSVMSGEAVLGLVRLMEAHPRAGIIQSAPVTAGLDTLHARAQQFAGRVTGRLFAAGMRHWQLGESHYWGHNAIIRIRPFMDHAALAPIGGRAGQLKGGLQGDILSHDFVEAALMRRAGWQVWLVSDLPGSYEQQPPHLLAELQRDRRWCQGNLQNVQLAAEPGLHPVHRAMFGTGAMAYLSAPLWLGFVLLGTGLWWWTRQDTLSVLPAVPALALWSATLGLLMLPRVLGVLLVLHEKQQALYGGTARLVLGTVIEALLSALQAPVRMAAHTVFAIGALTGLPLQWKSPPREAQALTLRDAAPALLPLAGVALAVLGMALMLSDSLAWWLAPLALPLLLAWPLAVATASPALGRWLQRRGLLLIPEEVAPPTVLRQAWRLAATTRPGATAALQTAVSARR